MRFGPGSSASQTAHRLINDPDPATEDLAALQVEAYEQVCFCRQALDAPCADQIDILAGTPDP